MQITGEPIQFFHHKNEKSNLRQIGVSFGGNLIFNLALPVRLELWRTETDGFVSRSILSLAYVTRDTGFNALELVVLWLNLEIAWSVA